MLNPKLLAEAFPVNKVEVFFDALDHSNFLGFSWERIAEGKFPVGYNSNDSDYNQIGETGGEKMHKLTAEELPPTYIYPNEGLGQPIVGGYDTTTGMEYYSLKTGTTNNNSPKLTANHQLNYNNSAHENRPPFIVMAFWKRVA